MIEYKEMQAKERLKKHTLKGRAKAATRKVRELAVVGHALASTRHVVMAQIVPMRFCNLSCAYCNEYDKVSKPVPLEEMVRRIDHLAALGASIITISGGEPLTHPEMDGDHRPHPAPWAGSRHDHQWIPADAGTDRAAKPCRS